MVNVKNNILSIIFILAIFFSVLSQNFVMKNSIPLEVICDIFWILCFIIFMITKKFSFKMHVFGLVYIIFIIITTFIFTILKGMINTEDIKISFSTIAPPAFIIYFISYMFFSNEDDTFLKRIILYFLISIVILSISLIFSLHMDWGKWLRSNVYILNDGKNAVGHIMAIAVILALFYKFDTKHPKCILLLRLLCIILALMCIIYVQCRTAIVDIIFVMFIGVFFVNKGLKVKALAVTLLMAILIILLTNERMVTYLNHLLLLDKYAGGTIDDFSSGRLSLYKKAFNTFTNAPLWGIKGEYYVDNYYLNVLVHYGILGGFIYFPFMFYRFYLNFKYIKKGKLGKNFSCILLLISLYELITSLVEALPPFGPGVSVLMFWVLSAAADVIYIRRVRTNGKFIKQ